MVRISARLVAKRAAQLYGPDRLSALPQELFLRICDYLVDYENDLQVTFGLTSSMDRIRPVNLSKGLRALHYSSKLLREKTSTSICKLGFLMTLPGLKALLRMAGDPQVAPHIIHVKFLFPTEMWQCHKATKVSYKEFANMLTDCFLCLINLRKIQLSGIKSEARFSYVADMPDYYSWAIGLLLCALHASKLCITDLIYDEEAEVMSPPSPFDSWVAPSPLPPAWLSGLGSIEKFRAVEHDVEEGELWMSEYEYTEQMLLAMPKLKELTITPVVPENRSIVRQEDYWRNNCISTGWMKVILGFRFEWRLTAFHASNFYVDSVNSFKNFLRTHSPTLQDLAISEVIVADPKNRAETNLMAKSFWTEIFQIILDDMSLRKGKFHDLLSLIRGRPSHYASVAMYWDQNNGLDLDLYGRKFEEVAMVRGVTRALTDWKDGMVMGEVPE